MSDNRTPDANDVERYQASKAAAKLEHWALQDGIKWVGGLKAGDWYLEPNLRIDVDPTSVTNALNVLRYHPAIKDCYAYDLFQDDYIIIKEPPWKPKDWMPHLITDEDYIDLQEWFETLMARKPFRYGLGQIKQFIHRVGSESIVNPPKDWFNSLKWDGVQRLDSWLHDYLGAEQSPYTAFVGRKWMAAGVARVFEPGIAFDHCLILEGEQRIGKSKALECLATINNKRYFFDGNLDYKSKEDSLNCQGTLIVEMADMAAWARTNENDVKAFITRRVDRYRPVYGTKPKDRPRMYIIAGTINPEDGQYFRDSTGNSRYWPVKCGNNISLHKIDAIKEQLWAEAVAVYKGKEKLYLMGEERELARIEQEQRLLVSDLRGDIEEAIGKIMEEHTNIPRWVNTFTVKGVMDKLSVPIGQRKSLGKDIREDLAKNKRYKEGRLDNQRVWCKLVR